MSYPTDSIEEFVIWISFVFVFWLLLSIILGGGIDAIIALMSMIR